MEEGVAKPLGLEMHETTILNAGSGGFSSDLYSVCSTGLTVGTALP